MEQSPKGPSTTEEYSLWRNGRDKEYHIFKLAGPGESMSHQEVCLERGDIGLNSPLQNFTVEYNS